MRNAQHTLYAATALALCCPCMQCVRPAMATPTQPAGPSAAPSVQWAPSHPPTAPCPASTAPHSQQQSTCRPADASVQEAPSAWPALLGWSWTTPRQAAAARPQTAAAPARQAGPQRAAPLHASSAALATPTPRHVLLSAPSPASHAPRAPWQQQTAPAVLARQVSTAKMVQPLLMEAAWRARLTGSLQPAAAASASSVRQTQHPTQRGLRASRPPQRLHSSDGASPGRVGMQQDCEALCSGGTSSGGRQPCAQI